MAWPATPGNLPSMMMTVLTALADAQRALTYQNAFLRRIYWDYQPIVAVPFQTLSVNIPLVSETNAVNIQGGALQPLPYAFTTVPILLDTNQSNSYVIGDWDQTRVAYNLKTFFFQPKLEELMRAINRSIVALFTPTAFNAYLMITSTSTVPGGINRSDITKAWANLAKAGVPMEDYDNVTLMVQTGTYGAMLSDQQFLYQYIVGDREAEAVQRRAQLRTVYGADVFYDQQFGQPGSITPPWNANTNNCVLFHRYAVAGVTALPPAGGPQVLETTEDVFGLPIRVQVAYDVMNQGWVVHMHCLYGLAVVRPEMGCLFQTATAA